MNEAGFHRTTLVGFVATWFPMSRILLRLMMCSASVFGNVKHLIRRESMPPQKRFQKIWCMVWHSGEKQGNFHCVNLRYIKEASERICTCLKKVRMKWTSEFHSLESERSAATKMVMNTVWLSTDFKLAGLCAIPAATTTWHLQEFFPDHHFDRKNHFWISDRNDLQQKAEGFPESAVHASKCFSKGKCQKRDFWRSLLPMREAPGICASMRCTFGCLRFTAGVGCVPTKNRKPEIMGFQTRLESESES